MSTFSCPVVKIKLEKHPNADKLSICQIKGWTVVVKTSDFENETLGVYIPVDSITSKDHLLLGFLQGKRVKIVKLRDIISQGILLPLSKVIETYPLSFKKYPNIDDDLKNILEIKNGKNHLYQIN